MPAITISDNIFSVGIQHPDRKMFDCLMPTPHGTTYNSYLISGSEKTALIDTVDYEFVDAYLEKLKNLHVAKLDYIIILHTEQDHSGSVLAVLERYPEAQLVATANVAKLMATHMQTPAEQFQIVEDKGKLSLGDKSLVFHKIPFAHWPDNTMVFEESSRILFSSDLFGSHYSSEHVFATEGHEIKEAARAYFAEIMMPFTAHVVKYVNLVSDMRPRMIASSHGPVWKDPSVILGYYHRWTSSKVENTVVIPYVSMHGSTNVIVERLSLRLAGRGVSVLSRNLGDSPESLAVSSGHVMFDLVMAAAVVFAIPTVLAGPHPAGAYCALLTNALRPKTKFIGLVGSYGWGTKVGEVFESLTCGLKNAKRLPTVLITGLPTEEDLVGIDEYADLLADQILQLGDDLL